MYRIHLVGVHLKFRVILDLGKYGNRQEEQQKPKDWSTYISSTEFWDQQYWLFFKMSHLTAFPISLEFEFLVPCQLFHRRTWISPLLHSEADPGSVGAVADTAGVVVPPASSPPLTGAGRPCCRSSTQGLLLSSSIKKRTQRHIPSPPFLPLPCPPLPLSHLAPADPGTRWNKVLGPLMSHSSLVAHGARLCQRQQWQQRWVILPCTYSWAGREHLWGLGRENEPTLCCCCPQLSLAPCGAPPE